jgi:hypothetical protein
MMKNAKQAMIVAWVIGALVPLFWGIAGFLLFNLREGLLSQLFWGAVYITCPFWFINGQKAIILMPILNGCMYAILVGAFAKTRDAKA